MFDNSSIAPLRKTKPHIVFRDGRWHVSKFPEKLHKSRLYRWRRAHRFVNKLNIEVKFIK